MNWLHDWWISLSEESKISVTTLAVAILALIGSIAAKLLEVRMIQRLYIQTLEKLDQARQEINRELLSGNHYPLGGPLDPVDFASQFPVSLERRAKRARVWLWLARRASQWRERVKKFG